MPATDFIKLNRTDAAATECGELLGTIRDLRSAYERLARIRAKMRHNFSDASGAAAINWSAVESLWGIPAGSTSVGTTAKGQAIFTLIDGTVGSLDGSFLTSAGRDLTETVG